MSTVSNGGSIPRLDLIARYFVGERNIGRCTDLRTRLGTDICFCKGGIVEKYADLRARLDRLNDPEARFELGEDARRAQLASLADQYLPELLDAYERLATVLYPRLAEQPKVAPVE